MPVATGPWLSNGEAAVTTSASRGVLDQSWSDWFDGLHITSQPEGPTLIAGPVADQAALHGVLAKARDRGLPLISVDCSDPPPRRDGGGDAA